MRNYILMLWCKIYKIYSPNLSVNFWALNTCAALCQSVYLQLEGGPEK